MKTTFSILGIVILFVSTHSFALPSYPLETCNESHCVANFKSMKKYARHNIPMATEALANFYMHGYGTEKDPAKALRLYERTAKHGSATAQYKAGIMYILGIGDKNLERGVNWMRLSVENKHYQAAYVLGLMHYYGDNLPQDNEKALNWFQVAADNGHGKAQYTLGQFYEAGFIVQRDVSKAVELYEKSSFKIADSKARLVALDKPIPESPSDDIEHIEVNPLSFQEMIDMKIKGMKNISLANYSKSPNVSCRYAKRNCTDVVKLDDFAIRR